MGTREKILEAVLKNQPPPTDLPDISSFRGEDNALARKYTDVFVGIGGSVFQVGSVESIKTILLENFNMDKRCVTTIAAFTNIAGLVDPAVSPHSYEDVELAIIQGDFCVAENGAVWLTETQMGQRIIPYICQHLAVVINEADIVPTLHEAYNRIGLADNSFSGFIAGPSKTADIEQALVLGAHGPLSMTVFLLNS